MRAKYFTKGELSLLNCPYMSEKQVKEICKRTPKNELIELEGGRTGVNIAYVERKLNVLFGWDYDFFVISEIEHKHSVVVKCRMTIRLKNKVITRENYGEATINIVKDSRGTIKLIGDAYKSARADALKKIASSLGVCWDVYTSEKEVQQDEEVLKENEIEKLDHPTKAVYDRFEKYAKSFNTEEELTNAYNSLTSAFSEPPQCFVNLYEFHLKRIKNE